MKATELKWWLKSHNYEFKCSALSTIPELNLTPEIPGPGRPQILTSGVSV